MPRKKKIAEPGPAPSPLSYIHAGLRDEAVAIDTIVPDPKNARKHGEESIKAIAASLREFGQVKPIIIHPETRVILAGNGTYAAAKSLGWTHLAALQFADPRKAMAYAIADNRTAELSTWDDELLVEYLTDFKADNADLFEELQLADILPKEAVTVEADKQPVTMVFEVVVGCKDEGDQKRLFERMQGENRKCRLLTM
jgi:ParB-like chromosome segregation protein Spo0J